MSRHSEALESGIPQARDAEAEAAAEKSREIWRRAEPLTNTVEQEAAYWHSVARAEQAEFEAEIRRDERS